MKRIRICSASEVPAEGMMGFDTEAGVKVLVVHAGDEFYAYQRLCPHQDVCLDEGFFDGSVLTCHQHLWQWDIKTGEAVGLAEAPLERFELEQQDGDLFVVEGSALRASELFKGVADAVIEKLDALARREEFEAATSLYKIGDPTDDLYILDAGRVEFVIGREGRTTPAGFMLRKGEVFGWAALLEDHPRRIARAACLEKSTLSRLNGKEVLKVLSEEPAAGYVVMRQLSALIAKHLGSQGEK